MADGLVFLSDPATELRGWEQVVDRHRKHLTLRAAITPQVAQRFVDIVRAYPHLTPGVAEALARGGFDWNMPQVAESARWQADQLAQRSVFEKFTSGVAGAAKGVARGAFAALDVVNQDVVQRGIGAIAQGSDRASDEDGEFFNPGDFRRGLVEGLTAPPRSAAGQAVQQAVRGPQQMLDGQGRVIGQSQRVNLGSGILPGGSAQRDAVESQQSVRAAGMPATFGNLTSATFNTPGSDAHRKWAGLLDMGFELGSDPLMAVGTVTKAARAGRTFGATVDVTSGFAVRSKAVTAPLRAAGAGKVADKLESGLLPSTRLTWAPKVRDLDAAEATSKYGLVVGRTPTIDPETVVRGFLASSDGGRLVNALAAEPDAHAIWVKSRKVFSPQEARQLADATSPDEVKRLLIGADGEPGMLGFSVRSRPSMGAVPVSDRTYEMSRLPGVKRDLHGLRWMKEMPGTGVALDDVPAAARVLDDFLSNAKVDGKAKAARFRELGEATSAEDVRQVVIRAGGDIDAALKARGVKGDHAKKLLKSYTGFVEDYRKYAVSSVTNRPFASPIGKSRTMLNGEWQESESLFLLSQAVDRVMPLPDAREIRQQASAISWLWEDDTLRKMAMDGITGGTSAVMTKVWKPLVLLRGAWTVRVVGEEQVRMAAAGMTSSFAHPLSHIAWMTGADSDLIGKAMSVGAARNPSKAVEAAEEYVAALSRGDAGFVHDTATRFANGDWHIATRVRNADGTWDTPAGWYDGWASEVGQLTNDPIAAKVARDIADGVDPRETAEWFFNGEGKALRDRLMSAKGDSRGARLANRDVADNYLEGVRAYIHKTAGGRVVDTRLAEDKVAYAINRPGDTDFIRMIGEGSYSGQGIRGLEGGNTLGQLLGGKWGHLDVEYVRVPRMVHGDATAMYDRAVEAAFDFLMSKPTNHLSRSPAFKQFYWQRVVELAPWMDDATLNAAKAAARNGSVPDSVLRKLGEVTPTSGKVTGLDGVDQIAKAYGLDQTRKLLYDLGKRNQFFDITRNIFPFGEAWKEILTTWTRLAGQNPALVQRAQTTVDGLRQSGVFYEDEYGDEVFAIPMSEFIGGWLAGSGPASGKLKMQAGSLNLFSQSVLPGFGPVVQMPVAAFADEARWDNVRKLILPFDQANDPDSVGDVVDKTLPAWMRKLFDAASHGGSDHRLFGNATIDVMRARMVNGQLSPEDLNDQATVDEAKGAAQWLYLIRGVIQFAGPAGPMVSWEYEDKTGRVWSATAAADVYFEMREHFDGDDFKAAVEFEKLFGFEPWDVVTAKTTSKNIRATDSAGVQWERQHSDLVDGLPRTAGLFAPQGDLNFDNAAYQRQIINGDRKPRTPEEWRFYRNDTAGQAAWREVVKRTEGMEDTDARTRLRAEWRAKLQNKFPGFDSNEAPNLAVDRGARLRELEAAYNNEALRTRLVAESPSAAAIFKYIELRQKVVAHAESRGFSASNWATRKDGAGYRAALRQVGEQLKGRSPDFAYAWERVFSGEVEERE